MSKGLVSKYCEGCRFLYRPHKSQIKICDYLDKTGDIRPCPAGDGCFVRESKVKEKNNDLHCISERM